MGRNLEGSVAAVEASLRKEKCSQLGATGEKLELHLARMAEIRAAYEDAPEVERAKLREEHRQARAEALRIQWNMVVQRETMGLTRHDDVYAQYVIPPPLQD